MIIQDFVISRQIYVGPQAELYQGFSLSEKKPVIIKYLKKDILNDQIIARFEHEYKIIKSLKEDGTIAAYHFEKDKKNNNYYITMQDFNGITLKDYLNNKNKKPISIKEFLNLAIEITQAVAEIHKHRVIHKDINPNNILYDEKNHIIKIINFGIASNLAKEEFEVQHLQMLEGSLYYISPEQTGRTNHAVDYRTDYYSLGVVFYEIITGTPPFASDDVMEMIHSHIAKTPISPNLVNKNIPIAIADIILKLMAKSADDRYQSTFGILSDLKQCLTQLQKNNEVTPFILGAKDISLQFKLSDKLYGRKQEKEILLKAYERVSQGDSSEMILVTGSAGTGKTRLIYEVYQHNSAKDGYFITGKFDQYNRNLPYSALIQALRGLIQQILTESNTRIIEWRQKIQAIIGNNGQVILDILPDLEAIIGKQPPVPELGLTETNNRFEHVFGNFVNALACKEHPIVIFLDDLQWADTSSLNLLQMLLSDWDSKYFLLLGAYRHNEVEPTHPLNKMIMDLNNQSVKITPIVLTELSLKLTEQLLADTLYKKEEEIKLLAKICFAKTHGNAFFLTQFLLTLVKSGSIYFDMANGKWNYSIDNIQKKEYTDNVVDFMVQKVRDLPAATQYILCLASCLGNRFDLHSLSIILDSPTTEIAKNLWFALEEGLVLPNDDSYQAIGKNTNASYTFLHDRVQQACYSLLSDNEKTFTHLKIGRLLLQDKTGKSLEEEILTIINHIDRGLELVTDADERMQFAQLNLLGGKKAKNAIAFKQGLYCFSMGLSLLPAQPWQTCYALTLNLYMEALEAAYSTKDFDLMQDYYTIIIQNAVSLFDKVRAYEVKLAYFSATNQFKQAIDLAVQAYKSLGENVPRNPGIFSVLLSLVKIRFLLARKSWKQLESLPPMTDERALAIMKLGTAAVPVFLLCDPYISVYLIYIGMKVTLKYGICINAANPFVGYGLLLTSVLKNPKLGFQYSKLGVKLAEQYHSEGTKLQSYIGHGVVKLWHHHLKKVLPLYTDIIQRGLNIGVMKDAGFATTIYISQLFTSSKDLSFVVDECEKYIHLLHKLKLVSPYIYLQSYWLITLRLSEIDERKLQKLEQNYNATEIFTTAAKLNDLTALAGVCFAKIICGYLLGDLKKAVAGVLEVDKYLVQGPTEMVIGAMIYFFSALTLLAAYPEANTQDKNHYLKIIKKYLKRLELRSVYAPVNVLHMVNLLKGQYALLFNKRKIGLQYLNRASNYAHEQGYLYVEAIANELISQHYLKQNKKKYVKFFISEAYNCYILWGAFAKVKQMQTAYLPYLTQHNNQNIRKSIIKSSQNTANITLNSSLDLSTIIKSSQTISKEIILNNLLKQMMKILIENAGAKTGCFLLQENNEWKIEAESFSSDEPQIHTKNLQEEILPLSIINYVIHSKKSLIIGDATKDARFSTDPYINSVKAKSILCMPLIRKDILAGILYLENRLSANVFTEERLGVLQLLITQIVISIDNARLYKNVVDLNNNLETANKSLIELNEAYARFVPKQFLNILGKKNILELNENNQIKKDMTIMFTDIRNYTAMSEKISPEENFEFINEFLRNIEPAISSHNGFVDKYLGDCIMALFPSADDALQASIDILNWLKTYNKLKKQSHQPPIKIGIGLNSGKLILGTVGGHERMDVTVISDAVNVASRIEHATKVYHTPLLITEAVYTRLVQREAYNIRMVDYSHVRGKKLAVKIYEVFNADNLQAKQLKNTTLPQFNKAVMLYHQQKYADALSLFKVILAKNKYDITTKYYCKRCKIAKKRVPG
jgi:predicted ATPase/class 3 adenylate cyclase/GAF domain-containing protein/tRNA A-37 threonylcarbamoyl transferase component Bud32